MKLTEEQWFDIVMILNSYRADIIASGEENAEYVTFIENLIEEIGDSQNGTEIEFEMDWDNPVSDDELDD